MGELIFKKLETKLTQANSDPNWIAHRCCLIDNHFVRTKVKYLLINYRIILVIKLFAVSEEKDPTQTLFAHLINLH